MRCARPQPCARPVAARAVAARSEANGACSRDELASIDRSHELSSGCSAQSPLLMPVFHAPAADERSCTWPRSARQARRPATPPRQQRRRCPPRARPPGASSAAASAGGKETRRCVAARRQVNVVAPAGRRTSSLPRARCPPLERLRRESWREQLDLVEKRPQHLLRACS